MTIICWKLGNLWNKSDKAIIYWNITCSALKLLCRRAVSVSMTDLRSNFYLLTFWRTCDGADNFYVFFYRYFKIKKIPNKDNNFELILKSHDGQSGNSGLIQIISKWFLLIIKLLFRNDAYNCTINGYRCTA